MKKILLFLLILGILFSCKPNTDPTSNSQATIKIVSSYSEIFPIKIYIAVNGGSYQYREMISTPTKEGNNYIYSFSLDPGLYNIKIEGEVWGDFTGVKEWTDYRLSVGQTYTLDLYSQEELKGSKADIRTKRRQILPIRFSISSDGGVYREVGTLNYTDASTGGAYVKILDVAPGTYWVKFEGTPWVDFEGTKIYKNMRFPINDTLRIDIDAVNITDEYAATKAHLIVETKDINKLPINISISRNGSTYETLDKPLNSSFTTDNVTYRRLIYIDPGTYKIKLDYNGGSREIDSKMYTAGSDNTITP